MRIINEHKVSSAAELHLTANHLNIGYNHDIIVADINLTIKPGQSLALVGTNGSGKSTLLKTIVGLIKPLRGELLTFGREPGTVSTRIAYLSQFHVSSFILPLRAIDIVRMGRFPVHGLLGGMNNEDDEIVKTAMHQVGIDHLANAPLWSLSGGQQQRTYIAQVLAHRAALLVLDEPTAGLDAGGKELFSHLIKEEISRGASVIVATHDIKEASECNLVMLLARSVVAVGSPEEVLTPELLLKTLGAQISHH